MNIALRSITAIFKKDLKDTLRNTNVMILLIMPPIFCLVFNELIDLEMGTGVVLSMVTSMCHCMIPVSFLAMIVAEEKEKNTLRTLMLSGLSAFEFIVSKLVVTWLVMQIVNTADFFLLGFSPALLPAFLLCTTLGSISLLLLGAAIGILCRDQMSTGVLATPVMLLLMFPTFFAPMNDTFAQVAQLLPIGYVVDLFFSWTDGGPIFAPENLKALTVMLAWIAIGGVCYALAYKKKRLDV